MKKNKTTIMIFCLGIVLILSLIVYATPQGPSIALIGNSTKGLNASTKFNQSGNGTKAGGYIFTINLNSTQQNLRWKAYVGNVTGTLVLQDSSGYSIYDWAITTSLTGEVYATRASTTVDWTNIGCATNGNVTVEENLLNHTNANDKISATFDAPDGDAFDVGVVPINASTCNTTNLYVNGSAPAGDTFEEVLLHDNTNLVYASLIEVNEAGYNTNEIGKTYDFQMIVAENASAAFDASTPYYFYIELT